MTAKDVIDLIVERAPRLRSAGVRNLEFDFDGCSVKLAIDPPEPLPPVLTSVSDEQREPTDPLYDPATFGRKSGTPGFDLAETEHE